MNLIDFAFVLLFFFGVFKGMKNGLFVEFASLIGLVVGLFVALKFSGLTRDFFGSHLGSNPKTAYVFAFVITFVAVVVGISLLAKVLTKVANFSGLGILNTIGGGIFGFARMLLLLSVFLQFFEKVNVEHTFVTEQTLGESRLYHPVKAISEIVYPFLREEVHEIHIKL